MSAVCPYCDAPLKRAPDRKTKCPACRQPIYVRSTPSDPTRRLVTESGKDVIDRAWTRTYALRKAERDCRMLGVSTKDFTRALSLADGDVDAAIDGLLHAVADAHENTGTRMMASLILADMYAKLGDPRAHDCRRQAERDRLLQNQRAWDIGIVVGFEVSGPEFGAQCTANAGRVFSLQDALDRMPLPCGLECRCWWRTVPASDFGYSGGIDRVRGR